MSGSDDDILRFIAASFPSVWALELVLVLKQDQRTWTHADMISALRASDLVISKAVAALVAAGLASGDEQGAAYMPVNDEVAEMVNRVERLYRTRANLVRRAIVTASSGSAAAFANAFKIRKGADD